MPKNALKRWTPGQSLDRPAVDSPHALSPASSLVTPMASKLALLAALAAPSVVAETILGVTVFSRHGDRTSKHYPGYGLTTLGFQQNYRVGADYQALYLAGDSPKRILGISEDVYVPSQIYASAPDQKVLLNTATAFLQGLYPPLGGDDEAAVQTLNNGSDYAAPLDGYQYVVLHGENDDSPDSIWIKGDDMCPAASTAQQSYAQSDEYARTLEATRGFYAGFWNSLRDVYDFQPEDLSYANAYDIFDLINVARIHNASAPAVSDDDMYQLRVLADRWEAGHNMNASIPARSIGGRTLAGAVLAQLSETVSSAGRLKFSLLAGSYDTFLAFFSVAGLTSASGDFAGLPDYASTMAFELFTADDGAQAFPAADDDLQVRFLFRNGSDAGAPLRPFPLFGRADESMPWGDFAREMRTRAITDVGAWCDVCSSEADFCSAYATQDEDGRSGGGGAMSNAVAGVVGAMVTLAVVGVAGLVFFLLRRRNRKPATEVFVSEGKVDDAASA
ncbi:hypothetical protein S7711_05018 [Stachybotrys chartarum IBT 7711]|uniref:Acid phosphatase n=1 Tax=Stachybotrys chartarum (strain CBS 109288 / IBT 7711) TaxID=1280523 RepID=A0A084BAK7_STACB|nr:hypothetical protein S7711_05018 [Stachybotrys chartarum IBT 7711]